MPQRSEAWRSGYQRTTQSKGLIVSLQLRAYNDCTVEGDTLGSSTIDISPLEDFRF